MPPDQSKLNARAAAALVIVEVIGKGRSLTEALAVTWPNREGELRALVQAICFTVIRHHRYLLNIKNQLVPKPLPKKNLDIEALLLIGLAQLIFLSTATHAAVNETTTACAQLGKPWAKSLLNGVLRRFLREQNQLLAAPRSPALQTSHPEWLVDLIHEHYPDDWQTILAHNNVQAPMTLRVNTSKISRADYLQELLKVKQAAQCCEFSAEGVVLHNPCGVNLLPGFDEGLASVQDEAGQLAFAILGAEPGHRVLDACCAPGSKLSHLLEQQPALDLLGLDINPERLQKVSSNLDRIQRTAKLQEGDCSAPDTWWDGKHFDRILLDAPCSATGVIRRHPDIKLLRRPEDLPKLQEKQLEMLLALWPCLASNGLLLYATCSVLPAENEQIITQFLQICPEATLEPIPAKWGRGLACGRQILPGTHHMDGFYYALLAKG